ncbi:hypothetical protein LCGC14_0251450 [marine sediment metagenome]|uniref:Large polyvalent protein associated domain-containing protein n=1 Tax=marine sediment metagenome TaxID=412755 RepID=A0A0F9X8Y1_9ZZZZ
MSNGVNPAEAAILQILDERVNTLAAEFNPAERAIQEFMANQVPSRPEPSAGVGAGIAGFLGNIFTDPELSIEDPTFGETVRAGMAQNRAVATAFLSPTIRGVQSLAEIPGIFTSRDLPTDKAADFLERLNEGLVSSSERAALEAGLTPEAVADSHLFGEMVGYTVPVVAALKAARLATGIQGSVTGLARNFKLDTVAGGIFGALLTPGEELGDRAVNALRESVIFGVGGLLINGLIFGLTGMRFSRLRAHAGDESLDGTLRRIQNGEQVIIGEEEWLPLVQLMNEEGFLANSPEAQALLSSMEFEMSAVAGVRNAAEAGQSRGFILDIGSNFTEVMNNLPKIQEGFPGLKFDVIARDVGKRRTFDLHFGMRGLNNNQRAQLAREGRFAGQILEKSGVTYRYVRPAKGDRITVINADGKTTTIKDKGVSNLPYANEEIVLPTAGQAMYEDFREFTFGRMGQASGVSGSIPEEEIIRGIREGTLDLTDDARRTFDIGGAITHPEELGQTGAGTAEQFVRGFTQEGKIAGDLLEPTPIRKLDDAFESWVAERGFDPGATDIEAFRQNFAQRFRDDIWALVPEEDMAIFRAIREETNALIDERGLNLTQRAAVKGFHTDALPAERVALRDINTGARLEFGSEKFASDFVDNVVRSEKDPFGLFLSPGPHGMPALTGGFPGSDGIFTLEGNIASREFLRDQPFGFSQNRRDYFRSVEDLTGMPLFSKGFALMDEAMIKMEAALEPIGRRIEAAWKGVSREDRIAVAEFWTEIEGTQLTGTGLTRAAKAAGLSSKQIRAFTQSRVIFDLGAQMLGLPESRYISTYYSRIRPAFEAGGDVNIARLLSNDPSALKEAEMFWALQSRTGEMARIELDPEIVMHRYFQALLKHREVVPLEAEFRNMLDMRIRDLPQANQTQILRRAMSGTTKDSFVLPEEIRSVGQEYLVNITGDISPGFATARRFTMRMFKMLGMETDAKLFDELHSTYLSAQYGAAIGVRLSLTNRNAIQNMWTQYTRVGGKHGTESLRRALTQTGFDEAMGAQAIRPARVSVPQGDAIYEAFWAGEPITGTGPASNAMASALRHLVRLGRVSRNLSQKSLIPYGSSEQVNRAWAYHWQKMHTTEKLTDFNAGRIDWDKFLEDGLPFFSQTIKKDFRARFDRFGREAALQWIGKQAADEGHFIYGAAASPSWMQRPFGRLFGVFGQWPLWAFELYARRTSHATAKQLGQFWARTLALTGAFANMTAQSGINMWSWVAPASLEFGGGPFTDILVDMKNIVDSPLDRRAAALKRMAKDIGSLALPGQVFYSEFSRAMDESDPRQAALLLGLGRPVDQGNFAYDFVINPKAIPQVPEPRVQNLPSIDELLGRP